MTLMPSLCIIRREKCLVYHSKYLGPICFLFFKLWPSLYVISASFKIAVFGKQYGPMDESRCVMHVSEQISEVAIPASDFASSKISKMNLLIQIRVFLFKIYTHILPLFYLCCPLKNLCFIKSHCID